MTTFVTNIHGQKLIDAAFEGTLETYIAENGIEPEQVSAVFAAFSATVINSVADPEDESIVYQDL